MVARYRPDSEGASAQAGVPNNVYFGKKDLLFLDTGCTLLNCVIGGGWPLGRIVNVVGDRSTGKTLLAEEGMANFQRQFPKGKIFYRETEAAFDVSYAQALGLNTEKIDFGPEGPDTQWAVVEDFMEDLTKQLDEFDKIVSTKAKVLREKNKRSKMTQVDAEEVVLKTMPPSLYILDSLDAISSEAELKRDIREGSYGLEKQKLLGMMFRKETRRIRRARMGLIIISQIRDRIGPMIRGKKYTRSGGKALDFYASLVIYLSELGKVKETVRGISRPTAIKIKAKCEKNKIVMPHRECQFEIRFGYGIEDDWASLDWLEEVKRLGEVGLEKVPTKLDGIDIPAFREKVKRTWLNVEKDFTPERGKYAS